MRNEEIALMLQWSAVRSRGVRVRRAIPKSDWLAAAALLQSRVSFLG